MTKQFARLHLLLLLSLAAPSAQAKEWSIDDYHANLPEKFRTFSTEYAKLPAGENTVSDVAGHYVAYFESATQKGGPPYPYFELAVFKPLQGDDVVVVSNVTIWDLGSGHKTFFLRRHGDDWQDAEWIDMRAQVLPALTREMFFRDAEIGAKLDAVFQENEEHPPSPDVFHQFLHFSPARTGNRIMVSLNLEHYAPRVKKNDGVAQEFIENLQAVWLEWDKSKGVFKVSAAPSSPAEEKDWTVSDYLKHLPEKYRTHSGDFQNEPTAETTITDIKNGYIAYLSMAPSRDHNFPPYPIFEIAVYKQTEGEPLIVVSNTISDSVCTRHDTFFLRKRGAEWQHVQATVLPAFSPQMFFREAGLEQKLEALHPKFGEPVPPREAFRRVLHFSPPRQGTRMKVALDLCSYVPSDLAVDGGPEFGFFYERQKTVFLEWNKQKGAFRVAN